MSEDPKMMKFLREACGVPEPKEPEPEQPSAGEEAAKKQMLVWDYIMARKGRIEDVLDD